MTLFHTQVALDGYEFEDWQLTCSLAAGINEITPGSWNTDTGLTYGAPRGLAVALDTTTANQVKLAGAGDEIIGRLKSIENRVIEGHNVGTVEFKFANQLPIDPAATGAEIPVVGSRLKGGATAGTVQACDGTEKFWATAPVVVEVRGTVVIALKTA